MPNKLIFKSYDVRGIYPDEINEEAVGVIARAFDEYLKAKNLQAGPVVIGRDIRLSSEKLYNAAIEGLINAGRDVIEIGVATTPLFYFAVGKSGASGGIMITASHNPPEYNGMKFALKDATALSYESGLNEVEKLSLEGDFAMPSQKGNLEKRGYKDEYIAFLSQFSAIGKPIFAVLDAGNGTAGIFLPDLAEKLNIKHAPLFFDTDGSFPGRGPNPTLPRAGDSAKKAVLENKADCAFLFDADADRIMAMDEKGKVVRGDLITALLADEIIKPGDTALYDVSSSKIVPLTIEKKGGLAERAKTGTSNIKNKMREKNAAFAGEMSGHYYFRDFYFSDSAFLTLVYLLNIVSSRKEPFSEIIKPYDKFFHSGEMNFKVEDRAAAIEKFKEKYKDAKQSFIDGLTVEYENWWFNIRQSNTEPLIRLVIEADSQEVLEEKKKEFSEFFTTGL